jgi:hypothetical protein
MAYPVKNGRCVFMKDGGMHHPRADYPAVCRGFPWTDAETGGPYESDQKICPALMHRPELVQLTRNRVNGQP